MCRMHSKHNKLTIPPFIKHLISFYSSLGKPIWSKKPFVILTFRNWFSSREMSQQKRILLVFFFIKMHLNIFKVLCYLNSQSQPAFALLLNVNLNYWSRINENDFDKESFFPQQYSPTIRFPVFYFFSERFKHRNTDNKRGIKAHSINQSINQKKKLWVANKI